MIGRTLAHCVALADGSVLAAQVAGERANLDSARVAAGRLTWIQEGA